MSFNRANREEATPSAEQLFDAAAVDRGGSHSGRGTKPVSDNQRERWQLGHSVSKKYDKLPAARASGDLDANRRALAAQEPQQAQELVRLQQQQIASPHRNGETMAPRSNLPQTEALTAARANSGDTSFSSNRAAAEVEAGNASFRAEQQRMARTPGQVQDQGQPSGRGGTSAGPVASPFVQPDHQRRPSSDSSTDDPGEMDTGAPQTWRSMRRAQISDATSSVGQGHPGWQSLDTMRANSIALERKAVALERRDKKGAGKRSASASGPHASHPHMRQERVRKVELDPEAGGIWVDRTWRAAKGVHLTEQLVLGRVLGSGMQAHVFELCDLEGNIAPIVLKASRKGALISDTQREWATGQRLSALGPGNAPLPGMMKTGPAVCQISRPEGKDHREKGDGGKGGGGKGEGEKGAKLVGMILERMNGRSVSKVVAEPDFCDVHYLRDMLMTIFTAVDAAQRAFGFHHYDLRLDNVMEHIHDPQQLMEDPVSLALVGDLQDRAQGPTFKMIDFGLAEFDEMYAADEGADSDNELQESEKPSPWYMAPVLCINAVPEGVHRLAWKGKGDVYHLLFDLAMSLHGRCWPEKDRRMVRRLLSLIRHVTGTAPGASFAKDPTVYANQSCTPVQCFGVPASQRHGRGGFWNMLTQRSFLSQWLRQLMAWQFPSNPGLTASEVLTSPFFR